MTERIKFVCISLTGADERRELMTRQFAEHGIDAQFFDAIKPRNTTDDVSIEDRAARMRRHGRSMSRGEIGCYLSHREVWKQLVASEDDVCCVMEDDIVLRSGFRAAVLELAAHSEHWDIVRLMGLLGNPRIPYATMPSGMRVMWTDRQTCGTQCYVITRAAAAKMLRYTSRIIAPIDMTMDRHWEHGLRFLITSPEFVEEELTLETMMDTGPVIKTLSIRLREKFFRRMDKVAASIYNAKHRPKQSVMVKTDISQAAPIIPGTLAS